MERDFSNKRKMEGLKTKDFINIGIYTVIYIVFIAFGGMLSYVPILLPLVCVLVPLIGGIPFMLFLTRTKKFGMITIMGTLIGLFMLIGGMGYWTLPLCIGVSLLSEYIVKLGDYSSKKKCVIACGIFHLWIIGNILPFYIGDAYYKQVAERFGQTYADGVHAVLPGWMLFVLLFAALVMGLLGGVIGKTILNKNLEKAGIL
ncbi:energy-coupling factor transport system substrate-specific component [Acetitomaculum ruminis DSM 5522]|uniref:Energy-coupling factor transport system substrate-specific component n=1 Tax=Acetitomaculum ruminis DSM 5522 TaxID=1120918 RepID=A0A1I1ABE1_9FIRM|nr:MptD family putative ECF transporter S component [Acetitomaculum ruminis]SFB34666.1 energy-coupling factor transport system substrate-specific component [Acetitomaculum ruminis DSM 5522]